MSERNVINSISGGTRTKGINKKKHDREPLISYITVVYNRVNTIEKCINSVLNQSYKNIEYIIVDGGSNDGTLDIIKKYEDKIDFYISEPDKGIYDAMNKGVKYANGDMICFMNSDDACLPNAAEIVAAIYQKSGARIICGERQLIQNGIELKEYHHKKYPIPRSVFFYVQMFHQATYASKKLFDIIGCFDMNYKLIADWVWQSKAIDSGEKLIFTDEPLAAFEFGGASNERIYDKDREWINWVIKTFPDLEYKDAKSLLFSLDRGRNPMFKINTLNKIAFKYLKNNSFVQTYYATVLNTCTERIEDILALKSVDNCGTESIVIKKNGKKYELIGLLRELDLKLLAVCQKDVNIKKEDLEDIALTKKVIDRLYLKTYIKEKKADKSGDYIITLGYLLVSKMFSGSLFMTSHYYELVRWIWNKAFRGKFIER